MRVKWLVLPLLFFVSGLFAAIDTFEFNNEAQRDRFRQLSEELRCPKCQNQNLAGSNSAIALDLRQELHRMVLNGNSTKQIKTFMVDRYGEFVLYKPAVNSMTYFLWYGPFGLLILGFVIVYMLSRGRAPTKEGDSDSAGLLKDENTEHRRRIKDLLDRKHD